MVKVKLEAILGKGKKTIYSKSGFKGPLDVSVNQIIDGVKSQFYPLKQLKLETPPPPNLPPEVSAGDDLKVNPGTPSILLDGSVLDPEGRLVRANWSQLQGPPVDIVVPDPTNPADAYFSAPNEICQLLFQLEAEDDAANITRDATIVYVGELPTPPPPPTEPFPIPCQMFYSSDMVLSHPGTYPSKKRSPYDPVLLFSNASSVSSHTISDGWLTINHGDQYGRTYWELYELPEFNTTNLGLNTAIAGIFKMHSLSNDSNFSLKLGNHGTTGYSYDGKTFVGGGGLSFHEGEIQSKFEWRHGKGEGPEKAYKYLDGKKLQAGVEYPFFAHYIANQAKNELVLNTWISFDGKWQHTMADRIWEKDSEWERGIGTIPTSALDYADCVKGPAFLKFYHLWTRANEDDVDVQKLRFGIAI